MDEPVITLDIDWAPDWIIDDVADLLIEHGTKATWFVTHASPGVERLRERSDLFELGIHPNFLSGSTQGTSEDGILGHCRELVPEAVSMRTHALYQSSGMLARAAKEFRIRIDSSLFLPRSAHLHPHVLNWFECGLTRLPYFWEDDHEMFEPDPAWTPNDSRIGIEGLRIFDFHPVHIALNTEKFERYEQLKMIKALPEWDREFVEENRNEGLGTGSMFIELVRQLGPRGRNLGELI